MLWQDKNGKIWQGGYLKVNDRLIFNPKPEHFIAAGYTEYTPAPPPVQQPTPPQQDDFAKIKADFWGYVDAAAEELTAASGRTYTRADFPLGAFSSELLAWCAEHELDQEMTNKLTMGFCGIAADLARIGRNWNELFEGDDMYPTPKEPAETPEAETPEESGNE